MVKKLRLIMMLVLVTAMLPIYSICSYAEEGPVLTVESITAEGGSSVKVPVKLTNNTGICGATIQMQYADGLVLTGMDKGDAVPTLTMTKPGKFSANPVKITWDGLEEDKTNGTFITFTFTVPDKPGKYDIIISYEYGDIVDGDLNDLTVTINNGSIIVPDKESNEKPKLTVGNITAKPNESVQVPVILTGNTGICGAVIHVKHDDLVLTNIEQGTALSSLVMTKPGNFKANPFNVTWDGLEQDTTDGTLVIFTFTAPASSGNYPIEISYDEDGLVDGDLNSVDVDIVQGMVTVEDDSIAAENIGTFNADNAYTGNSKVATAFKANLNNVSGTLSFTVTSSTGETHTFNDETIITDTNIVFGIIVSGLEDKDAKCMVSVN